MKPSSFAIFTLVHLTLPHPSSTKKPFPQELVAQILQVILREALDVSSAELSFLPSLPSAFPSSFVASLLALSRRLLQPYEDLTLDELMDEVRSFAPYEESRRLEHETREVVSSASLSLVRGARRS